MRFEITGEDIGKSAYELIGIPYQLHGVDILVGLDCVGLLVAAFKTYGIDLIYPGTYENPPPPRMLLKYLNMNFKEVQREPITGDVLLLSVDANSQHLGIFYNGCIIHASAREKEKQVIMQNYRVWKKFHTKTFEHINGYNYSSKTDV